ncbi:MAG TPA: MBL fold metallo-hydrolase [Candidatus Sumerlaeota bacterium]|nr:MBL fold metallo-hydrolase [Candidatus Sumerlaeota bacterium]
MMQAVLLLAWIGQACFTLQVGETRIVLDPVPAKLGYFAGPFEADVVTVSHEHFDHNALEIVAGKPQVLRGLTADGKDWSPVHFENKDVKITSIPVYHDDVQGAKRGKNAMFLIEAHGLRILHTGDLGHPLSPETLKQVGKVDVLLICVGGYYTVDGRGARAVIEQLKPRVVVPMHYKTDPKSELPIATEADFLAGWKHVKRADTNELALTADLSEYPADEPTVLVLPPKKPGEQAPKGQ